MTTLKQKKEFIKDKLKNDMTWMSKCLILLYENQTDEERRNNNTYYLNGCGFDSHDVLWMSPIAKKLANKEPVYLTRDVFYRLKVRLPRYWKQVLEACNEELLNQML